MQPDDGDKPVEMQSQAEKTEQKQKREGRKKDMMTAEKKIEAAYNKMEQKKNNLKKVYHRAWLRISYYTSYDKLNKWYEKELSEIKKQFHEDVRKAFTA